MKLDAGKRAGVLTHPYLMAAFAYTAESSPIHRGVFLARGVLGVALRPPPGGVRPARRRTCTPSLTTRERVALQTAAATAMSCHGIINPLGFTLENFDAVGRFRDKDNGKPVDATGGYQTRAGKTVAFTGARELADVPGRQRRRSTPRSSSRCSTTWSSSRSAAYGAATARPESAAVVRRQRVQRPQAGRRVSPDARTPPSRTTVTAKPAGPDAIARPNGVLRSTLGGSDVAHPRNRREFIRDLGLGAAALPFLLNLPSLGFANQATAQAAAGRHVQPQRRRPADVLAGRGGGDVHLKESLKPLEPFKNQTPRCSTASATRSAATATTTCAASAACSPASSCSPATSRAARDTPAGWASGISIDQEIKNYLQKDPATRTRFGSLEFGVMVPERADTWTRMVYAGPNKPIAPIDDPYQMFAKLYGRVKDRETPGERAGRRAATT